MAFGFIIENILQWLKEYWTVLTGITVLIVYSHKRVVQHRDNNRILKDILEESKAMRISQDELKEQQRALNTEIKLLQKDHNNLERRVYNIERGAK